MSRLTHPGSGDRAHARDRIGGSLLSSLIEEASASGRALSIDVEANNPAGRLYDRLGFQPAGEHGVYVLMERAPT